MKKFYLPLLIVVALLFSNYSYGQKEAKYLMYKAHTYVDNKERQVEAFDTYVKAMRVAKKRKLVKEIARGMHTCALYLGQEASQFKDKNDPNAGDRYAKSWEAFKTGEKRLSKKQINPYVMYVASMTAFELDKEKEAQPYLEYLKQRNYGKAKVYVMLASSYQKTNPKQATSVLKEGLSKYPNNKELIAYSKNYLNSQDW